MYPIELYSFYSAIQLTFTALKNQLFRAQATKMKRLKSRFNMGALSCR